MRHKSLGTDAQVRPCAYAISVAAAAGIVAVALKLVTGGCLFFLAHLFMRTHPPLPGPHHNLVVLAPLLASWLVLLAFPRNRR